MAEDAAVGCGAATEDADASALAAIAGRSAAQMSGENFPVALRLVPRRPRAHLARIYEYARFVDDVGDEAEGDRLGLLETIEVQVRQLWGGAPTLAPVRGLAPVVADCAIPIEPLLELIEANRIDQRVCRYQTFTDLLDYCTLSAAPVGQLVLHVAGRATAQNIAWSDQVCAGLQVLEHCQDVGEDARAGRVYLPAVDLRAAGVGAEQLLGRTTPAPLRRVVATQVDRAGELLRDGRPLVRRLSGWARLAVAGYVAGGLATAAALRAADHDVLAQHVAPSRRRLAVLAARLVVGW